MIDAYGRLGLEQLEGDARRVLAANGTAVRLSPTRKSGKKTVLGLRNGEFFELDTN